MDGAESEPNFRTREYETLCANMVETVGSDKLEWRARR